MHIHILGVCGTFMGGVAVLAKQLGHKVTGSDENVYPPMSDVLADAGIEIVSGFAIEQLEPQPDLVVIGNAMSRGNPCVEHVLNRNMPYISGPQWLLENLLKDRWVLAVAGTHGKTTTASMLAQILEFAGYKPGFLIGGVPGNFNVSARLGDSDFFVVEADEYDSAFFDKRSKFVHYHPRTLIINNIEFDHADIFLDLDAIERQFHHLVRTVPGQGRIIAPAHNKNVYNTLKKGLWSEIEYLAADKEWSFTKHTNDGSCFAVQHNGQAAGIVSWELIGEHNIKNAVMAIAAARHVGVEVKTACEALNDFISPKRRLELKGTVNNITLYDDFAHHPTAIAATIAALRAKVGQARILAVLEPRSNSMRMGTFKDAIAPALTRADQVFLFQPENMQWDLQDIADECKRSALECSVSFNIKSLVRAISCEARAGDYILVMSNGGFGGIHAKIMDALQVKFDSSL